MRLRSFQMYLMGSIADPPYLQMAADAADQYESVLFAVRGYLYFVNVKNPVTDLSRKEVDKLMSGKLRYWSKNAVKISQICYSGSEKTVPRLESGAIPWVRFADPLLALQMVVLDETAIGILPLPVAAMKVNGTKLLTVAGITATPGTVMAGTYPASVRYYLSIRKDAPPEVRELYKTLRSKQTKQKLMKAGILPAIEGD